MVDDREIIEFNETAESDQTAKGSESGNSEKSPSEGRLICTEDEALILISYYLGGIFE